MKKVMHFLFLSCFKATLLIEKKLHIRLSFKDKLRLQMHKMMCEACTNFDKQNSLIQKGIEQLQSRKNGQPDIDLKSFEKTIIKNLEEQQSKLGH